MADLTISQTGLRIVRRADFSRVHEGHSPGGPQDRISSSVANLLVGNARDADAIEWTMAPGEIHFSKRTLIVVAGAPSHATIDDQRIPTWEVVEAPAGSTLKVKIGSSGCRTYVAVAGGFRQSISPPTSSQDQRIGFSRARVGLPAPWVAHHGMLRFCKGPESAIVRQNPSGKWTVSPQSSGMGVRLTHHQWNSKIPDLPSAPVADGTIQATPFGPIILLRNRGTLGGYPRIGQIITADVDRVAQLRPGDVVDLTEITEQEALEISILMTSWLERFSIICREI